MYITNEENEPDSTIASGVLAETVEAWSFAEFSATAFYEAKQKIMTMSREAVYCGHIDVRQKTKDDLFLSSVGGVDQAGRKRSASV
jgi:hypothetical protein